LAPVVSCKDFIGNKLIIQGFTTILFFGTKYMYSAYVDLAVSYCMLMYLLWLSMCR